MIKPADERFEMLLLQAMGLAQERQRITSQLRAAEELLATYFGTTTGVEEVETPFARIDCIITEVPILDPSQVEQANALIYPLAFHKMFSFQGGHYHPTTFCMEWMVAGAHFQNVQQLRGMIHLQKARQFSYYSPKLKAVNHA